MLKQHSTRARIPLQKLCEVDAGMGSLVFWAHHLDTRNIDPEFSDAPDLAPAYTDGSSVYYGQKYGEWRLEEKVGVAAHELLHIAFCHVSRFKELRRRLGDRYDQKLANIAADAIINEVLRLAGYSLPSKAVYLVELFEKSFGERIKAEEAISDWSFEKLYMRLINESSQSKQKTPGMGMAGASGPSSSGNGGQTGSDQENEDGDGNSPCASAKSYADEVGHEGDIDASGPITPEDAQKDHTWKQHLSRAIRQSTGMNAGKGRGVLGHRIADFPDSRTPWEIILRRLLNKAVSRSPRQSYSRPARRWIGAEDNARRRGLPTPAYEPGIEKTNIDPRIVIGVDVSGSIGDSDLEIFCGEIASISRKKGCALDIIVFDDGVISTWKVAPDAIESSIRSIDFARGGGTSFIEMIETAATKDPSALVVLTDLYGPFGPAPKFPVIWAAPQENPPEAPFGTVISLAP